MFRFLGKESGVTLLDVLLVLLIVGMLIFGIVFALVSYTNIFSFINGSQVVRSVSSNIFKTVVVPVESHQQIIINLDNNEPFETIAITQKIMFPFSKEKKIATEWPKGKTGFLVKSYDGSTIEMLGYRYKTIAKTTAKNGYNALLDLTVNNIKRIDKDNINYPYLYVWLDYNQNAQVDKGELISLKDLGITSIDIGSMKVVNRRINSSVINREGSYFRADGSKGSILEVDLFQDPFYREFLTTINVPDKIKPIPNVQGTGLVRDLQEATAKSSALLSTVVNYYSHESLSQRYTMLNNLLFEWARSENMCFATHLSQFSTDRFKLELASDLKPDTYRSIHSEVSLVLNHLMVVEQFTGKRLLYVFAKEVLNTQTGEIELHLAISLNNEIIARNVVVANSNQQRQEVVISNDMLNFTNEQKIQINEEYEAVKKNIFAKLQAEKPDIQELIAEFKKDQYRWVDESLQNQIETGAYFIRERKTINLPRRRYLIECIKPGNIIDQQVRDCADGKIAKTW